MSYLINVDSTLPQLDKAAKIVDFYLGKKMRRGGNSGSMADHAARVAKIVAGAGYPEHVVIAAILHDLLEDTSYAGNEMRHDFGEDVFSLVLAVTKDKRKRGAKQDRTHLAVVAINGPEAVAIKVADNTDNLMTPQHVSDPKRYMRYAKAIQQLGCKALGPSHPLVLNHLIVLRQAQMSLPASML